MYLKFHNQRGAAIIVALFVVSLVAIAAIAMIDRLRVDIRRTELSLHATEGSLYAAGSVAWAMETLNDNWKKQKPNQLTDHTPITSPVNEIDRAKIVSTIYAADAKFNINNLKDPEYQDQFVRLIQIVQPDTTLDVAKTITANTQNWISQAKTALDEYYSKQNPPYREPHRLMASVSEFRLVKGVSKELYQALIPFITALPETTAININEATAPILMSLSETLTKDGANTIINARKKSPFPDTASFLKLDVAKNNKFSDAKISTVSQYFLVKTEVKVNDQNLLLYTLLHREVKKAKPVETILWQSKGTL